MAPAEIRVFLDGKRSSVQVKNDTGWAKAGIPFNITRETSILAIKMVKFRDARRKNEKLLMLAAFDCNRLRTDASGTWNWKCTSNTDLVNTGWLGAGYDDSEWETPVKVGDNADDGNKEFPYISKISNCDPDAEYIWMEDRGGPEKMVVFCRATLK